MPVHDSGECPRQVAVRLNPFSLQVSMREAKTAQFWTPAAWPAKRLFLLPTAMGRMVRSYHCPQARSCMLPRGGVVVYLDPTVGEEQNKPVPVFCDVFECLE